MTIPAISRGFSAKKMLSVKASWQAYAQSRWPHNTVCELMGEFDLTYHQARTISEGNVSLATIDQIERHKNAGPLLALDMLLVRFGINCQDLADKLDEEAERERIRTEASLKPRSGFARRLAVPRSFDREG